MSMPTSSDETPRAGEGDSKPGPSTTQNKVPNPPHGAGKKLEHRHRTTTRPSFRNGTASLVGENEPQYTRVKVLILTFKFNDLKLDSETSDVQKSFRRLGYEVIQYDIEMSNPSEKLKKELQRLLKAEEIMDNLLIIYYHGHGGRGRDGKTLELFSHNRPDDVGSLWKTIGDVWERDTVADLNEHLAAKNNRFQSVARVPWEDIRVEIMAAKCHTLVILDCCNAGLAAINTQEDDGLDEADNSEEDDAQDADDGKEQDYDHQYRKELIGACAWGKSTRSRMSPAMCKVLKEGLPCADASMSTFTLARRMNNYLINWFDGSGSVPQAVHYVLRKTSATKLALKRVDIDPEIIPISLESENLNSRCGKSCRPPKQFLRVIGWNPEQFSSLIMPKEDGTARILPEDAVQVQVLSHNPVFVSTCGNQYQNLNDDVYNFIRSDLQLKGALVLPMDNPAAAVLELKRWTKREKKHAFIGALIHFDAASQDVFSNGNYREFWKELESCNLFVYLHPMGTDAEEWPVSTGLQVLRLFKSGLLSKDTKLKIVVAHMPGMSSVLSALALTGDTEFRDFWRNNVWVTANECWRLDQLRAILDDADTDGGHILFSTENDRFVARLKNQGVIVEQELHSIGQYNAEELLKNLGPQQMPVEAPVVARRHNKGVRRRKGSGGRVRGESDEG